MATQPLDRNGKTVRVGDRVRLLQLSGQWFDELPADEKPEVMSMIGEIFEVEEIDDYGRPWIRKNWSDGDEGTCHGHSIALDAHEMELVADEP